MTTIADLLGHRIEPESFARGEPEIVVLSSPIVTNPCGDRPYVYEAEVFNFLLGRADLERNEPRGVKSVLRFKNLRVDGAVILATGQRLAVEIKLRMNWETASKAVHQFRRFLMTREAKSNPVVGGVVFFEEFSADWCGKHSGRTLEDGWNHWYEGYSTVENLPLDLLRVRQGCVQGYPMGEVVIAKINLLSSQERSSLLAQLTSGKSEIAGVDK
jgi:hypothetical protein